MHASVCFPSEIWGWTLNLWQKKVLWHLLNKHQSNVALAPLVFYEYRIKSLPEPNEQDLNYLNQFTKHLMQMYQSWCLYPYFLRSSSNILFYHCRDTYGQKCVFILQYYNVTLFVLRSTSYHFNTEKYHVSGVVLLHMFYRALLIAQTVVWYHLS